MPTPSQQIRFCTSADGVRIAYATSGSGPPLVKVGTWMTHVELDWESSVWRHWLRELSRDHTFLRYDARGCAIGGTCPATTRRSPYFFVSPATTYAHSASMSSGLSTSLHGGMFLTP